MTDAWREMNILPVLPFALNKVDFKVEIPLIKKQLQEWYQWLTLNMGKVKKI